MLLMICMLSDRFWTGATAYFVLFADFGEKEHCFSSVSNVLGAVQ